MNHEELLKLAGGEGQTTVTLVPREKLTAALKEIVELHKQFTFGSEESGYTQVCSHCQLGIVGDEYPCETIQIITKELQ